MREIWKRLREQGIRHAARVLARLVIKRIYWPEKYLVFRRSTEPIPLPRKFPEGTWLPIDEATARAYAGQLGFSEKLFIARLNRRLQGYFLLNSKKEPVGHLWYCAGKDVHEPYYGHTIRLQPTEGYLFDAFLLPAYRPTGAPIESANRALQDLRNAGCKTVLVIANTENTLAWRFHLHCDFTPFRGFRLTRVFTRPLRHREVDLEDCLTPEIRKSLARHRSND